MKRLDLFMEMNEWMNEQMNEWRLLLQLILIL